MRLTSAIAKKQLNEYWTLHSTMTAFGSALVKNRAKYPKAQSSRKLLIAQQIEYGLP